MVETLLSELEQSGFICGMSRSPSSFSGVWESFASDCVLRVVLQEEKSGAVVAPVLWTVLGSLSGETSDASMEECIASLRDGLGSFGRTLLSSLRRLGSSLVMSSSVLHHVHVSARMFAMGRRGGEILRDTAIVLAIAVSRERGQQAARVASVGSFHYAVLESEIRKRERAIESGGLRLGAPAHGGYAGAIDSPESIQRELERVIESERLWQYEHLLDMLCEWSHATRPLLHLLSRRGAQLSNELSHWQTKLEGALFDGSL